jgi:hypothetical protein
MNDDEKSKALIAANKTIMDERGIDAFNAKRYQDLLQEIEGQSGQ